MATKVLVYSSLLLLQCTLDQCSASRIDGFGSVSIIPDEFLALKNYGAMDFLSSPIIESIKPNILSTFPSALASEAASENLLINSIPYVNGVSNFEIPSISLPVNFDAINKAIPRSSFILETPITLRNTPVEPFITNYPTTYELNPVSILNSVSPNLYVEEAPIIIPNLPTIEVPVLSNFAELNPFVSVVPNTVSVLPILEVPSNNIYVSAIELPPIPQVSPCIASSSGPVVDVFSPILYETPTLEPLEYINSFAGPTPLAFEFPVIENIRTFPKPQVSVPTLSSDSFASTVSNIRSMFESLPTLSANSRVRSLGGISCSDLSASRGNSLFVTSFSPKRPTGISIRSENTYQGPVSVSGSLPFLGTVGFSGSVPSSGYGTVNYRCGSGKVEMVSESPNILNIFYPRR